jgi:hypothetical protein
MAFVGGPCCPTIDFVIIFRIMSTFYILLSSLFCIVIFAIMYLIITMIIITPLFNQDYIFNKNASFQYDSAIYIYTDRYELKYRYIQSERLRVQYRSNLSNNEKYEIHVNINRCTVKLRSVVVIRTKYFLLKHATFVEFPTSLLKTFSHALLPQTHKNLS